MKSLAREQFLYYFLYTHKDKMDVKLGKHHYYFGDIADKLISGEVKKVLIDVPPQHGKSVFWTETFPSYFIQKNPGKSAMVTGYGKELVERFGENNRSKIQQYGEDLFGTKMSKSTSSKTNWKLDDGRTGLLSKTIDSGLNGSPGDLIIVDDPYKNMKEAIKGQKKKDIISNFESVILMRLGGDVRIVVIHTRWTEDDLIGRQLARENHDWLHIHIPLLAEEGDVLGRKPGEALFPEIGKDEVWAEGMRKQVSNKVFNSLMQGNPLADDGDVFKKEYFIYYDVEPDEFEEYYIGWDTNGKKTENGDCAVGQVWGKKNEQLFLLDQYRDRPSYTELRDEFEKMYLKYADKKPKVIVEDKQLGQGLVQRYEFDRRRDKKDRIYRDGVEMTDMDIIGVNPTGDKDVRIDESSVMYREGKVVIPRYKHFTDDFVTEVTQYPNYPTKDIPDVVAMILEIAFGEQMKKTRISIGGRDL
ncbi:terminase large subunit domain-containing protein [Pontibacillus sp. HN14]|nr:terminase family protein [Pontibacillus sp. HN14]